MNNSKKSAYPIFFAKSIQQQEHIDGGLTKREYFAALAMVGILANYSENKKEEDWMKWTAKECIFLADELLKQLE